MQSRLVAKTVARHSINFTAGSVAVSIARQHRSRFDNHALDTLADCAAFVGGYFAGSAIADSILPTADREIDQIFDFLEKQNFHK